MNSALRGLRIGFIERPHPPGHRGSVTYRLIPLLRKAGALIELVHAETNLHRLDTAPPWDLVVLKSGSAAALHLAAAVEAQGIPSVNGSEATRLAQDKLASAAILQRASLPIAPVHLAWLSSLQKLGELPDCPLIVKAARSSQGVGLWSVGPGSFPPWQRSSPKDRICSWSAYHTPGTT